MTYWPIVVAFTLGAICGTFVRLPLFVIISVLYVGGSFVFDGKPLQSALVSLVLLFGLLQLGYVLGLMLRVGTVAVCRGKAQGRRMAAHLVTLRTRHPRASN